jgi:hypothetical protein
LKRVKVEAWDGSNWQDRGSTYYRYYKAGDGNGFAHGLKYLVDADGYARLVAASITPETADNTYIASVARQYFEYDGSKRDTKQQLHGATQTSLSSHPPSGFSNGMNRW